MRSRTLLFFLSALALCLLLALLFIPLPSERRGTDPPTSNGGLLGFIAVEVTPLLVLGVVLGWLLQPRHVRPTWIAGAVALLAGVALAIAQPETDDPHQAGPLAAFLIMAIPAFVLSLAGAAAGRWLRTRRSDAP